MSAFITTTDYEASIHTEILDAITRNDPAVIEMAEDRAVEEITGYLSSRFDCDNIFNKTTTSRNSLILMFAIDITLYHLHAAYNPMRFPEMRKDRYNRAISWLKSVQKGDISPSNLPLKPNEGDSTENGTGIDFTYQAKRTNSF